MWITNKQSGSQGAMAHSLMHARRDDGPLLMQPRKQLHGPVRNQRHPMHTHRHTGTGTDPCHVTSPGRPCRKNSWDFYANEYTVPPGEKSLCKEFVNLMMFRDPLSRLTSHISWIQKLYKQVGEDVRW